MAPAESLLDSEPLVSLLSDRQFDTLALGQRDERLVSLANHEDVSQPSSEHVALRVLDVDNIEGARMLLPGDHSAHSPCVSTSSNHTQVSNLELDAVLDFVGGEVQLDAVVHISTAALRRDMLTLQQP